MKAKSTITFKATTFFIERIPPNCFWVVLNRFCHFFNDCKCLNFKTGQNRTSENVKRTIVLEWKSEWKDTLEVVVLQMVSQVSAKATSRGKQNKSDTSDTIRLIKSYSLSPRLYLYVNAAARTIHIQIINLSPTTLHLLTDDTIILFSSFIYILFIQPVLYIPQRQLMWTLLYRHQPGGTLPWNAQAAIFLLILRKVN